jgi:quinoprotein glucose dehydrogenase
VFKTFFLRVLPFLLINVLLSCSGEDTPVVTAKNPLYKTWNQYLGDPGRTHFSKLEAFTPENVGGLSVVWEHDLPDYGQMQMNPIIVDSVLYGVSAALRAFALDARTGERIWIFGDSLKVYHSTSRGVSYWADGEDKRILYTLGSDLWCLNALTGKPVSSFGEGGKIDLRASMPEVARNKFVISNTPGTIFRDLIIMPLRVSESVGAAPGDIMAFNVRTGELEWVFHTIPYPAEVGYGSWENPGTYLNEQVGAANNWAGMALDQEREILYVPTGSAAPDFYGGIRKGMNLFSDCLLALDANTGERLWHFQFIHHDLWDRDPPAPPNLLEVRRGGEKIPAVAQVTKQGFVFVFDRVTGEPLFEIKEEKVPPSSLYGEQAWPFQPVPVKPLPFARQAQDLTPADLSPYAPVEDSLLWRFQQLDTRRFAPPGLDPVLMLPGFDGGAEWGGAGTDPEQGILYVNSNEMPWILQMRETPQPNGELSTGERAYRMYCMMCHQASREGLAASGYPSLIDIGSRLSESEILQRISNGKGMMPAFPQIGEADKKALLSFLMEEGSSAEPTPAAEGKKEVTDTDGTASVLPYQFTGYTKFLDSNGHPAIAPPWGTLHAIDLNSGEYLWSTPFGDTPGLKTKDSLPTGTENYGGPVVTENGLLFIAATKDGYFRAFDRNTGELLWEYELPAPAFATPALYEVAGKQYIALACGGEKLGTPKGNKIIAFSLRN